MTDYESDSSDGVQPDMIAVSRAEWERVNARITSEQLKEWKRVAGMYPFQADLDNYLALIDTCERQRAQLAQAREALEKVEWVPLYSTVTRSYCPWCRGTTGFYGGEHEPTCPRQAALAALDAEV